jgi:DNA-binding NarL/FixJ family response regulator
MPFERARTQLMYGELQRRQRHWVLAATCLQQARGTFEALNTPLWAARARTALARTNVGVERGTGLSESERRVAELAASGITNRDIGAALFISTKTVESTLSNVYRKLGIRSRAELGRRLDQLQQ